jgi:GMP synthase (glutamine-hydrolysing)
VKHKFTAKSFLYSHPIDTDPNVKGIILSGSPASVNDENPPQVNVNALMQIAPMLGICYGAQWTAQSLGGTVSKSNKREYGRAMLQFSADCSLFKGLSSPTQVWMSHSDSIKQLPDDFTIVGTTEDIPVAAYQSDRKDAHPMFGLQFHPEVYHSTDGKKIISNFLLNTCGCSADWTPAHFITETIESLRQQIGDKRVVMGLSGGVDSTVAATLIHRAIGKNLFGIFVNNGLLRLHEFEEVLNIYDQLGLQVKGVDASDTFYTALANKTLPEDKRKAIGKTFIDVFDQEAHLLQDISFLGQGTIYPDVIESVSVNGPSVTIKSHHNVGGLPETMKLSLVEPLRFLFKDEVRRIGVELGIPSELLNRHPFPGPGLGIRILGEVDAEKVTLLQKADHIFIEHLKNSGWYNQVWQAGTILLPVKSVGVMGDERTYEFTIALRAVTSVDGMTADWAHLPHELLAKISNDIINQVRGINRVVYDISSKPPATIEWE